MSAATWTVDSISHFISASTKLELNLHELDELMQSITSQDRLMRSFAVNSDHLEPNTLLDFAEITVSPHRTAIQGMLDRIHLLVVGSKDFEHFGNTGTFRMIDESLQVRSMCSYNTLHTHTEGQTTENTHCRLTEYDRNRNSPVCLFVLLSCQVLREIFLWNSMCQRWARESFYTFLFLSVMLMPILLVIHLCVVLFGKKRRFFLFYEFVKASQEVPLIKHI